MQPNSSQSSNSQKRQDINLHQARRHQRSHTEIVWISLHFGTQSSHNESYTYIQSKVSIRQRGCQIHNRYIKCRGTRWFQDIGRMSPNMTALWKSQDKIGWGNLMEGWFSKHFYEMQFIQLAFGLTFLDGEDWVKKTTSKVLQITTSQWIYCNISLHDKKKEGTWEDKAWKRWWARSKLSWTQDLMKYPRIASSS